MPDSPNETAPGRGHWELNGEAFDRLLNAFDSDREAASRKYEALRRKLIDLFAWERSEAPEDLADEALNRLARRVSEGVEIPHPHRYALGIARMMLQEEARSRRNRYEALREIRLASSLPAQTDPDAGMLDLLRHCLDELPKQSRDLIERYYHENRAALARSRGISVNALRNRALRIREQLFDCVNRKRDIR